MVNVKHYNDITSKWEPIRSKIKETLEEYYKTLIDKTDYNIFGVFVNGSQCYNLDDENSDIDAIAWFFPSMEDLSSTSVPYRKEHIMENGAHCMLCDIRFIPNLFEKGDFLHYIPFWEESYIPTWHNDRYRRMMEQANKAFFYNFSGICNAMKGMVVSNKKLCLKLIEEENYQKAGKAFSYMLFLEHFILQVASLYNNSYKFPDIYKISDEDKKDLMEIKRGNFKDWTLTANMVNFEAKRIIRVIKTYEKIEFDKEGVLELKEWVKDSISDEVGWR